MKRRMSFLGALLSLFIFSGCVTETVSKNSDRMKSDLSMSASTIDRDRESGIVSLHVHAMVQQGPRVLKAQHIEIDKKMGTIFANENCSYQNGKTIKKAQAMRFKINDGNWTEM